MTLAEHKTAARLALESLIAQCSREIRNLERFDDARCLIATADIWSSHERAQEAAETLAIAFEMEHVSEVAE
jgi:hypothetical protein